MVALILLGVDDELEEANVDIDRTSLAPRTPFCTAAPTDDFM